MLFNTLIVLVYYMFHITLMTQVGLLKCNEYRSRNLSFAESIVKRLVRVLVIRSLLISL